MTRSAWLRVVFAIWLVAYPVISCGPAALLDGGIAGAIGSFVSFTLGSILLVPWLLGLLVLGGLVWITGSRHPR